MTRRTFFSFHYAPDIWRAWNVRNSWVLKDDKESVGFFDNSVFEASKKQGDDNLKRFLRDGLQNTSVTCVLSGKDTWQRRWVRYEIVRSVLKGNGILTVDIYGVQDSHKNVSQKGADPLSAIGLYRANSKIYFAEWRDGKWIKYTDYTDPINEGDLWFDAPMTTTVEALNKHCMRYDFTAQNGRSNLGGWIDTAAGLAGR
ncbi:hypothetical protein J2Y55_004583 [Bosea sp. BE125]|uniref:TIR domain-containing protein n=1 Tax=Bosea sp. BE125 TaxID=2817909 RepID=UPI00285E6321|nr:TIR domain-containing protein [Bosea sp. BE125]MDR6873556.1 hypothetical protein [Bosea sp. BE125]